MKNYILKCFIRLSVSIRNNKGQAMTEYGLIVALIAVVLIVVIAALGNRIKVAFQSLVTALGG